MRARRAALADSSSGPIIFSSKPRCRNNTTTSAVRDRVVLAVAATRQAPAAPLPEARASIARTYALAPLLPPPLRFASPAHVRAALDGGRLRRRAPGDVGRAGGDAARGGGQPAAVPARPERARRARRHRRARRRDGGVGHRGSGQEALHEDEQGIKRTRFESRRRRTG